MAWDTYRMYAISLVLVVGVYLAWHFTHQPHVDPSCMWHGQRLHGSFCP